MAVALLLLATLGLRLWWGWHVGRQLAAQREEIRARGEPVDPADLTVTPLPDDQNAWVLIKQAGRIDDGSTPASTNIFYPEYPPFGAAWDQATKASEQRNREVFRLARLARARPQAQVVSSYGTPLFASAVSRDLSAGRAVANTLGDGAVYRHLNGDDAEAIERLLDALHIARSLDQDHGIVSQLVATGVAALANARVKVIAPGLRLESPAVRRGTAALIEELLDERPAIQGFRGAFVLERLQATDLLRWLSGGAWVLRPLADQPVVRANSAAAVCTAAADAPNAVAARRALAGLPADEQEGNPPWARLLGRQEVDEVPRYSRWYSGFDSSRAMRGYFEQHFRGLAERRTSAVSLAAQLYRADHAGRWPDQLAQLVPAYLPAVPADPFYDDGRPIGYVILKGGLPGGGDRPLVYFDAGTVADDAIDAEPMYGWQQDPKNRRPRVEVRQYRDLARWSPPVRRFDQQQRAREEEERKEQEEADRLRREEAAEPGQPPQQRP